MRYFLDTEFNGFGGGLISLALVSEAGPTLYLVYGVSRWRLFRSSAITSNRSWTASPPA